MRNFSVHFLRNFVSIWMKFSMLPQLVGLLKLMQNVFCTIVNREFCWCDCVRYMINVVFCLDTWKPICFKFSMRLDTAKLYSLLPVWMILMFSQSYRVAGKLELVLSFCWKVVWSSSNIREGWLCMGDDCEGVVYGRFGSFEHLLFLLELSRLPLLAAMASLLLAASTDQNSWSPAMYCHFLIFSIMAPTIIVICMVSVERLSSRCVKHDFEYFVCIVTMVPK